MMPAQSLSGQIADEVDDDVISRYFANGSPADLRRLTKRIDDLARRIAADALLGVDMRAAHGDWLAFASDLVDAAEPTILAEPGGVDFCRLVSAADAEDFRRSADPESLPRFLVLARQMSARAITIHPEAASSYLRHYWRSGHHDPHGLAWLARRVFHPSDPALG